MIDYTRKKYTICQPILHTYAFTGNGQITKNIFWFGWFLLNSVVINSNSNDCEHTRQEFILLMYYLK